MAVDFRVDPATKQLVRVTESPVSEDELRVELQAEADAAQNRLNAAKEDVDQKEAAHAAAEEAVVQARVALEAAEEEVAFSTDRMRELDETLRLRDELVGATPETENAESPSEEAVKVDVKVADQAPA